MKEAILLFALLLSAMNIMAQAYEFETREKTLDDGTRLVICDTKDYAKLSTSSPDIDLVMRDYYTENKTPVVLFRFRKYAKFEYRNSFAVARKIRELALSIPNNEERRKNITIKLFLSNDDILCGINEGIIYCDEVQRHSMVILDSTGVFDAAIPISLLVSSHTPEQTKTTGNTQVICQQLRTHDIVKIEVDGVSFDVRGLRSAATFNAMFDALAAKTSKGHLYRSSGASSSSTPSATAELGFVGILPDGEILCRLDNLIIKGAKGKEVLILVEFEDVNTEDGVFAITEIATPSYDDSTYKSFILKGNVQNYNSFPPSGGRFKVYVEIVTGYGSKIESGKKIIGKTNNKYVTIYKRPSGTWNYD